MSKWHQFEVRQSDLTHRDAPYDLRVLYKDVYRWLDANASGKWKVARLRSGGGLVGIKPFLKFVPIAQDGIKVSVKSERDAALFKMFFTERFEREPFPSVIVSVIRRSLGAAIAHQLCGVQPMTGPVGGIFGLKVGYVDQNNQNNLMFGGSPSQRRAARRRLRKQGVVSSISYFRPKRKPISAAKQLTMAQLLENTRKELLRGR